MVPAQAIIEVVSAADSNGLVKVLWENHELLMFDVDIQQRGIEPRKS